MEKVQAKSCIEVIEGVYTVYDKEFESGISFTNYKEFKSAYLESPKYFTEEILISCYYLVKTGVLDRANTIIDCIERRIVGRDHCLDVDCLLGLIDEEGYDFFELTFDVQMSVMAYHIKKILEK